MICISMKSIEKCQPFRRHSNSLTTLPSHFDENFQFEPLAMEPAPSCVIQSDLFFFSLKNPRQTSGDEDSDSSCLLLADVPHRFEWRTRNRSNENAAHTIDTQQTLGYTKGRLLHSFLFLPIGAGVFIGGCEPRGLPFSSAPSRGPCRLNLSLVSFSRVVH